ncbi:MAG TPA: hypothetical protein VF929_02115 [Gemmatimonadaceae bacterium]
MDGSAIFVATSSMPPLPRDDSPTQSPVWRRLFPRAGAWPIALLTVTGIVLGSALSPLQPIRDAATFEPVQEVVLRRPIGYVLLAPVSDVLDTLTLLSARQHIALLATILVVYAAWWVFVGRRSLRTIPPRRRVLREVARIGVGLVLLVAIYFAGILMPRPMAALEAATELIVVDFHTHTKYSHDGRPDWTPEDVRTWHRDAGFDVAYISDHRTFEGARDAWANNPELAAQRTVLIPAIEVSWRGEHVNVLDADRRYRGLLTPTLRDIDESALRLASLLPGNEPVLVETLPGQIDRAPSASGPGTPGIRAIEVIDGAPQGLGQARRERRAIVHLADSANLALVAGSNHHGWGHASAGWTLMFIPGWRAASPGELSAEISKAIRTAGRKSTRVAERYVANTESAQLLPFTVPAVAWGMFRTMSGDERVVWIVWLVALYAISRIRGARRRAREPRPASV